MAFATIVQTENLRTLAFGSISGTYAVIGGPLLHNARAIRFVNNTDGDVFVSDDGTNNKYFVPKSSFVLYDIASLSAGLSISYPLVYATGSQFWVKQSSAGSTGAFYMEVLYGAQQ